MFRDRKDAGAALAEALEDYSGGDTLVLAIPRGGVEVGYQVAGRLECGFSLLISRKLPFPDNPESGFGAVAEGGEPVILENAAALISDDRISRIIEEQRDEIQRRIKVLRKGRPLPDISGRTVILVDDGLAMGSTMRAAVSLCREKTAGKVVVAVPVSGERAARDLNRLADETAILQIPPLFRAVAQAYQHWHDVSDREVLKIMDSIESADDGGPPG